MSPKYRAFYPSPATAQDVLLADPKAFPLRTTEAEAVQGLQNAWHDPPKDHRATHLIVYRIDGDDHVTPLDTRVRRRIETRAVG